MSTLAHHQLRYSNTSGVTTRLNTIDVWLRAAVDEDNVATRLRHGISWIVYIHGGAWRDPEIDAASFESTVRTLVNHRRLHSVRGFASIDYRLSPYPTHPRKPSTEDDPARNAKHPDHVNDISYALSLLDDKYGLDNYILVGHSCGATMAFQHTEAPVPACVVGVAGIYDLPIFVQSHSAIPVYEEIVKNAFGKHVQGWVDASPTTIKPVACRAVIAYSEDDELVDEIQAFSMHEHLKNTQSNVQRTRLVKLKGLHDELWKVGTELAKAIESALE